jgi:hypothetical protein
VAFDGGCNMIEPKLYLKMTQVTRIYDHPASHVGTGALI